MCLDRGCAGDKDLVLQCFFFFFQAEDGIRDYKVTGVQTCALPIFEQAHATGKRIVLVAMNGSPINLAWARGNAAAVRSEEHTSELQSPCNLVCRLLLEKKKNHPYYIRPVVSDNYLCVLHSHRHCVV